MSLVSHHTISLDGYVAGRDDEVEWSFEYGSATSLATETMERIGAIVAGRRWYELARERWNGVDGIYGGAFDDQWPRPPRAGWLSRGFQRSTGAVSS
jgi:hypothetical protein